MLGFNFTLSRLIPQGTEIVPHIIDVVFISAVSTPFFELLISWELNMGISFKNILRVIVYQFLPPPIEKILN